MQRVLTINIPFTVPWAVPYGPAVVNGILKHAGYNVTIWDMSIDFRKQFLGENEFESFMQATTIGGYSSKQISKSFAKKMLSWMRSNIRHQIQTHRPDIVLLSVFSSQSLDLVVPVSTVLREEAPDSYVLVGGRGLDNVERQSKLNYGEYFAKYLPVDATYSGDAENSLLQVLEDRYQGHFIADPVSKSELMQVPAADWTGLKFEAYDGYDTNELRIPLTASKGCVRQCTFCDVAGSWPKYVFKSGADVAQEIIDIYHNHGINKIEFTDNLVNGSISNFRAMNTVLAERLPNVIDYKGYAICRPKNEFPESDFELASVAGASFFKVGIESGSERIRNDMKKKFTNDDIDWFAINCAKYNITQSWLMFAGYPTETEEDFQDTLRLLEEYKSLAQQGKIMVFLSLPMMLTTNSGFMRNYAESYGLEHNADDSWSDFFWTSSKYVENTFEVRADRWRRFMNKIVECGYLNPGQRQSEKLIEIEGLEKIYKDYKNARTTKKIIPIINRNFELN
jgi:radical SAM superfamily enzyme YgiQ (UPF0313 family)